VKSCPTTTYPRILRICSTSSANEILQVRDVLQQEAAESLVLQFAHEHACLLMTCSRDDFIELAQHQPHHSIVVIIRRRMGAPSARRCSGCLNGPVKPEGHSPPGLYVE